ncbi:3-deoxy-7-phosphoheptulonate synthase [Paraburkholderia bryophila]|uniref:3-deoxy-7-phosphoheptulonate synthase n=1 Tax=Paraburkholderia bryophila TaxID=420952 RepID=UPI003AEF6228
MLTWDIGRGMSATTPVIGPAELRQQLPCDVDSLHTVMQTRHAISEVLQGLSGRLVVIVGPCSIHDPVAALEYAARLSKQRHLWHDELEIVMRVYFEKPRTTVGWKGLINDPHLDGSHAIDAGIRLARQLMLDITRAGVPVATEFLDVTTPHYLADLVSWGAIGARTTESQIHRELASGLPCPIGFKNGTDGNVKIAIDAIHAAGHAHHFLGVTESGRFAKVATSGNQDCHLVLRGGKQPNYDAQSVAEACASLAAGGLPGRVVIDASHGNSCKQHDKQLCVCDSLCEQIAGGGERIAGVMLESNLLAGRQDVVADVPLAYGQSITDACIGWDATEALLGKLAEAVRQRRLRHAATPMRESLPSVQSVTSLQSAA